MSTRGGERAAGAAKKPPSTICLGHATITRDAITSQGHRFACGKLLDRSVDANNIGLGHTTITLLAGRLEDDATRWFRKVSGSCRDVAVAGPDVGYFLGDYQGLCPRLQASPRQPWCGISLGEVTIKELEFASGAFIARFSGAALQWVTLLNVRHGGRIRADKTGNAYFSAAAREMIGGGVGRTRARRLGIPMRTRRSVRTLNIVGKIGPPGDVLWVISLPSGDEFSDRRDVKVLQARPSPAPGQDRYWGKVERVMRQVRLVPVSRVCSGSEAVQQTDPSRLALTRDDCAAIEQLRER